MLDKCLADADTADHNLNLLQIRGRARGPWLLPILSPCRGIRLPNLRVRTQAADQVPASAPELPSRYPSNVEAASSFLPCADSRSHSWGVGHSSSTQKKLLSPAHLDQRHGQHHQVSHSLHSQPVTSQYIDKLLVTAIIPGKRQPKITCSLK